MDGSDLRVQPKLEIIKELCRLGVAQKKEDHVRVFLGKMLTVYAGRNGDFNFVMKVLRDEIALPDACVPLWPKRD